MAETARRSGSEDSVLRDPMKKPSDDIGPAAWTLRRPDTAGGDPARPRLPGWLVVGAVGRNSGKTEFACAVIERFTRTHPVVGVKVTAIADGEAACPRGRDGCGVCTTLEGDFQITEESGAQPGKDTARMRESGARQVYWIRCRRHSIQAALRAFLPRLGPGTLVVAESNSLARAIEPDLFVMLKGARAASIKPSAADAMPFADRVVVSADGAFDLNLHHLAVADGTWHLAEASAAILAGGASGRMGQDKSLLPLNGRPLICCILCNCPDHGRTAERNGGLADFTPAGRFVS